MHHKTPPPSAMKKQRGALLVISIFIMIVILLLALTLQRVLVNSQQTIVYEVYGAKAYHAAESGIEHNLTVLFPTAGSSQCNVSGVSRVFLGANGLSNCRYQTSCQSTDYQYKQRTVSYYRIESLGSCQIGDIIVNRRVLVDAKAVD